MTRYIIAFIIAALVTFVAASLIHTQVILAGLGELGADVPLSLRMSTSLADLLGLAPAFGAVVMIALLGGLLVAGFARRFIPLPRPIAFAVAGAAAMATTLWLMHLSFAITPIASARTTGGLLLLCLAGAFGGVIFAFGTKPSTGH